jgi:heme-dependent oxidative N-demethylase alpha subunit-like protein
VQPARPFYFPVKPEPFRMLAGLQRFGTDFGNGEADRRFFPRDATSSRYLAEKTRVLASHPERSASDARGDADEQTLAAALVWMTRTLRAEGQGDFSSLSLAELAPRLVEDFAILARSESGADRALWLHACFPGGWRPEHVIGRSFAQIHSPIPAIGSVARSAAHLASAMTSRGPYVRFVWTISADDELDHHPEQGRRSPWTVRTPRGFLRVERQVTVPLADHGASVFLIRTSLYGFDELTAEQRATLSRALAQMPPEIARYKRLELALPRALELLR